MKAIRVLCCLSFVVPLTLHAQGRGVVHVRDDAGNQVELYTGSYALVISVADYTDGWPDLPSVPREMDEVGAALTEMGFAVTRVSDPEKDRLRNAFQAFIDAHGYVPGNRLLFFFSGHGHSRDNGEKGYLVPTNAPNPRQDETGFLRAALPMSQIHAWCRQMEAKHALFLFDSCFSGSVFKTKALPDTPPHITASTSKPVRQFISAGSANQQVPAKSVFQPLFLRGMRGAADLTGDGYITGTEMGLYLSQQVPTYDSGQTPQFGKLLDPDLDEGDFVLVSASEESAVVTPVSTMGTLTVTSVPLGATVSVEGRIVGVTPLATEVDLGLEPSREVEVGLVLDGYRSKLARVVAHRNRTVRWRDVQLERIEVTPVAPDKPMVAPAAPPEATRLLQELSNGNVTDARRRDIGVRLAEMGDPRPGVGVENGVPEIDWVFVSPGGSVNIRDASKEASKTVAPFYLARHEVTYAQYEAFVKASDGFDNPAWWRNMRLKSTPPTRELDSQNNRQDNAPRDNVTWHQAVAFTRWMTVKLRSRGADVSAGGLRVNSVDWEVRLPAEWEWQWAAQGGPAKREYPWGVWQSGHANAADVLKSTTAVGMYPQGAAASGALDMSGNVWEWCLNTYSSPHSTAIDAGNANRVLRGGSFYAFREDAASSFRIFYPRIAWGSIGFRVGLFPLCSSVL
jgi:formylglycine-generating enzyme required for sulfatase activity